MTWSTDPDRAWEPDHFACKQPLADQVRQMCEEARHTNRRQIDNTACGQCWETVIC
jgi:ParB family chromosome partitioning protein